MVHGRVSHSRGGEGGESAKSDGELKKVENFIINNKIKLAL
jgi:hypothetical protein